MKLSNVSKRKKKKKPLNVTKVRSHLMLVLPNVTIEMSNVRKKLKYHLMRERYDQYDVGTT